MNKRFVPKLVVTNTKDVGKVGIANAKKPKKM
jgi:hypothetical protein